MAYDKLYKKAGEKIALLTTVEEIRAFLEIDDSVTGITAGDIANWNTAYGWGNHASEGYLTSETDPTVPAGVKAITNTQISNWDTAYGWGNHASAGYLTALPSHTHPLSQITQSGASTDQVPSWNGSAWVPVTISTSNIYTADGTLSGNRALTLSTYTFSIKKSTDTYFHVFNNGNIRLGSGTPSDSGYKLQVDGSILVTTGESTFTTIGTGAAVALRILDSTLTSRYTIGRNTGTGFLDFIGSQSGFSGFRFVTSAGDAMTIANNGNVSILGALTQANLSLTSGSATITFSSGGATLARSNGNGSLNLTLQNFTNAGFYITGQHASSDVLIAYGGTSAAQLKVGYNSSNYLGLNISSAGVAAYSLTGASMSFDKPIKIGTVGAISTKAILDLQSTALGYLPPRMTTTQKNAISSPATALQLFDTDLNSPDIYVSAAWHHKVIAPNSTKVTAGAPYTNDGYVEVIIAGVTFKLMTTA